MARHRALLLLSSSSLLLLLLLFSSADPPWAAAAGETPFRVGVILDLETLIGNVSRTCIAMAAEDFYAAHPDYKTRVDLHFRNSGGDAVGAASAGRFSPPLSRPQPARRVAQETNKSAFFC